MISEQPGNLWRASHQAVGDAPALSRDIVTDLLIVGAGFTGCSAALEGAQTGAGVVVLEAGSIGQGGSGRNVGLVNAGLWLPPDRIIATLGMVAGRRLIESLSAAPDAVFGTIAAQGIDCGAVRNGTLHLAHAPKGLRELEDRFRQSNRAGAPLQLLDAKETARRTGSDAFHGALFDPRAGTIQPLAYCRGLAQAARATGAQIFENAAVSQVWHDGTNWHATSQGHSIRARHLILATNAYAHSISGVPRQEFVPVHFSQFATAPLGAAYRGKILPGGEGCWDTDLVMSSVRLDGDGRLVIGGCGNLAGLGARLHWRWAARKMATLFPALAGLPFTHAWEGKIAMTADHLPKVVAFGPGALSIFGYSGRGIGPGTVFGKCAAQALLHGNSDALPVRPIAQHQEPLKRTRTAFYEIGATAIHALKPRPI